MQPPDPHKIPYTPIQQNPWPVWPYAGPGGGKGGGGAFVLAEDCTGPGFVYAWPATFNAESGATTITPGSKPFKLGHQESTLFTPKPAKAGYKGQWKSIDGQRVFDFGPCIDGCQTSSSISPGSPPDGEVGTAYTHTVSVSGLNEDGVSSPNLPPGLTINSSTGEITGTPTTAGTYFVVFTADSNDDPACPLTRMTKITIAPEGDTGLEPDPEVTPP